MSKEWSFKKTNNFYNDLAMQESSGVCTKENQLRYIGLYQFGEATLVDVGYYNSKPLKLNQKPGSQYNNDWSSSWTGKYNITSKQEFLVNPLVQNIAVREYHKLLWGGYLKNYQCYQGQEICNITLTKSGIIGAGHLVGHDGVKKFINSNGKIDVKDGNGVPCSEYLTKFAGYEVDYSIDVLAKNWELLQQDNESSIMGELGSNKLINSKLSQLLSNPEELKNYENQKLEEAKTLIKDSVFGDVILKANSTSEVKENQEFVRKLMQIDNPTSHLQQIQESNQLIDMMSFNFNNLSFSNSSQNKDNAWVNELVNNSINMMNNLQNDEEVQKFLSGLSGNGFSGNFNFDDHNNI